ncbi:response regulator receiver sensor signal transduction histidine kinase [Thalassoporum mexicanum PCC 7367]|uniref:hybrid sensor histidine kinase/response regulator n=1 Tax=Thalassoporum mexicanum TaxID=3457544 RepID=UPI00029F824A|nr:ATP-binding protein [Pseudanabaena sp. PCC 7367]AFY71604.1 response regulator receiver sensor signal transduction histidine kinase [Pseudanabaena sp. PCC 7367]
MNSPDAIEPSNNLTEPAIAVNNLSYSQDGNASATAVAQQTLARSSQAVVVLLVDDQPIVAESIRRLLASEPDIQFHYCGDVQKVIPTAIQLAPTIILQDLVMPDADGLMLVKFFRANPALSKIPVVILSTKDEATAKAEAFAHGANDYLVKLPDPIELVARIRYHSAAYVNLLKGEEADRTLAYNKELEQRVDDRTAELQQTLKNLKQTQAQMVHNEKMSSLGQLVAGIAHEINNPINFIYGNIKHVKAYVNDLSEMVRLYQEHYSEPVLPILEKSASIDIEFINQDLPKLLISLDTGVERIRNLVLGLRNFARHDESPVKAIDIHEGIDSTLLILKHKIDDIEIVKDYGDLPLVECCASQINQVFMNILANAADALDEAREVGKQPQPKITIRTAKQESDQITIELSDNGIGIPPEVQQLIFDPFFTTKIVGEGTGLGLSISHQIVVDKHKGKLDCISAIGNGTTFRIELPTSFQIEQDS